MGAMRDLDEALGPRRSMTTRTVLVGTGAAMLLFASLFAPWASYEVGFDSPFGRIGRDVPVTLLDAGGTQFEDEPFALNLTAVAMALAAATSVAGIAGYRRMFLAGAGLGLLGLVLLLFGAWAGADPPLSPGLGLFLALGGTALAALAHVEPWQREAGKAGRAAPQGAPPPPAPTPVPTPPPTPGPGSEPGRGD